jgi:hypothetical protein
MIKSRMRWAEHVAQMGEYEGIYAISGKYSRKETTREI